MRPVVLTNAFLRPRASRLTSGVTVSKDTNVYACVEEMISVIRNDLAASPLMLPTLHDRESVRELLLHIDGIMLPGATSNIHPSNYDHPENGLPQMFDLSHDETDLFLIDEAKNLGLPFFGICRSMQAMNVAFGGTLHQSLKTIQQIDHTCSYQCDGHDDAPHYMHDVSVERGSVLSGLFPSGTVSVNSLHEQAIDKLGDGLMVEGRATDGIIEAISWSAAPTFFVAVQWHPEAMPENFVSRQLFRAFKSAVEARCIERHKGNEVH